MTALTALQSIVAQQNATGVRSEGERVHTFLNERIEHYTSFGVTRSEALRRAQEDRRAQL